MIFSKDFIKQELAKSPENVHLDDLSCNHEGRLKIKTNNGVEFESFIIKGSQRRLYVFLSAVGVYRGDSVIFHRVMWANKFDGISLFIDDPQRKEKKFAPMFYWGDRNTDNTKLVAQIVAKIKSIYGLVTKDICFISSSNGGFASIKIADYFENSKCYALCPQISIPLYFQNKDNVSKFFDNSFDEQTGGGRLDVSEILNNPKAFYFIYSNVACKSDFEQMKYLLKYKDISHIGNGEMCKLNTHCVISLCRVNAKNPHVVQPDESFISFLDNFNLWEMSFDNLKTIQDLLAEVLQKYTNMKETLEKLNASQKS